MTVNGIPTKDEDPNVKIAAINQSRRSESVICAIRGRSKLPSQSELTFDSRTARPFHDGDDEKP